MKNHIVKISIYFRNLKYVKKQSVLKKLVRKGKRSEVI